MTDWREKVTERRDREDWKSGSFFNEVKVDLIHPLAFGKTSVHQGGRNDRTTITNAAPTLPRSGETRNVKAGS